jgi:hypothetical protein
MRISTKVRDWKVGESTEIMDASEDSLKALISEITSIIAENLPDAAVISVDLKVGITRIVPMQPTGPATPPAA